MRKATWMTGMVAAVGLTTWFLTGGCGNEVNLTQQDPVLEYQGSWMINSMTEMTDGVKVTWIRSGLSRTLHGDVRVEIQDDGAHFFMRYAKLAEDVPTTAPTRVDFDLAIDGGQWILESHEARITPADASMHVDPMAVRYVYDYEYGPEGLMLYWSADDTRNIGPTPPLRFSLVRTDDWGSATRGIWDVDTGCETHGDRSSTRTTLVTIDDHQMFEERGLVKHFVDDACRLEIVDADTRRVTLGLLEEEGSVVRLWTYTTEPDVTAIVPAGRYAEYEFERLKGDRMKWTRTACMPKTLCEADVPETIVMTRAKRVNAQW